MASEIELYRAPVISMICVVHGNVYQEFFSDDFRAYGFYIKKGALSGRDSTYTEAFFTVNKASLIPFNWGELFLFHFE